MFKAFGMKVVPIACFLFLMGTAFCQYKVFVWDNFDDGIKPSTLEFSHEASPKSVFVHNYQAPGTPPSILDGKAHSECGPFGLRFKTGEKARFLSVVDSLTLNRNLLGDKGRALYQADFYLPHEGEPYPAMSVFAVDHEIGEMVKRWNWYRFGIDNQNIYFSYNNGYIKKGAPVLYLHEKIRNLSLRRPGWHRFQIVFEGKEKIICAIDGSPLSFSPIMEGALRNLRAGIMVASAPDKPGECFADNLSVQWTPEDVPFPDSPWVSQEVASSPSNSIANPLLSMNSPTPSDSLSHNWLTIPEEAWQKGLAEKKSLLILFYAPRVKMYQELLPILEADPHALNLLSQFILLKIEVNQLKGGKIAETFKVNKVPAFVVMEPVSGKETARAVMLSDTPWAKVAPVIQGALKP
ncbi:thioredoxin family protein [Candidatus Sumerlaeota bacterium]|nr:thioredoxin family protein [Candidatus Sumerlaeota bacterium]